MIYSGIIAETFQLNAFIADIFILFMYIIILFFLLTPPVRQHFSIGFSGVKLGLLICVGSVILYTIYFVVMLTGVSIMEFY
ncbi:MAG: hypothetical protein LRY73_05375 [Bacillus sp. (in: Bacteria)]|nr:hypothetical protein [Bacillus sp. (in: firmicutes)]